MASSITGISTVGTYLMYKDTTWKKLIDIRDYPTIGGDKNKLDVTTLSDSKERQIDGVEKAPSDNKFVALYGKTEYAALLAKVGQELDLAIWLGHDSSETPDGHEGIFEGKGTISLKLIGKGVDEVRECEVGITMSTPFTYKASASA